MMQQFHDHQYLSMVRDILDNGVKRDDRTGTGTFGAFGRQLRFSLRDGSIPLLTTKKMHTKSIIHELLWFLKGDTNIKYLNDNGVRIWNEWADENGDLGPVYGSQWRRWPKYEILSFSDEIAHMDIDATTYLDAKVRVTYIDQIARIVNTLKNNPVDRRIIVSAWNVGELADMKLPPCHYAFQFWARPLYLKERVALLEGGHRIREITPEQMHQVLDEHNVPRWALTCMLHQRSCDVGLGVPFNIVQYSILTHLIAHCVGMVAEEFIWDGGDVHVYTNHVDALREQLTRVPMPSPTLRINTDNKDINNFKFEDFEIIGYESHPTIKMEVSV